MKHFSPLTRDKAIKSFEEIFTFFNKLDVNNTNEEIEWQIVNYIKKYLNLIYCHNTQNFDFHSEAEYGEGDKRTKHDPLESPEFTIGKFYNGLKKTNLIAILNALFEITNEFISIEAIKTNYKITIIDAENRFLKNIIDNYLNNGDENITANFINIRLNLVKLFISNCESTKKNEKHFNVDIKVLYNIWDLYLGRKIETYLYHNQIFQIFNILKNELNNSSDLKFEKILVKRLIYLNNQYLLEPPSTSHELLDEYSKLFNEQEREMLGSMINTTPKAFDFKYVKISQGSINEEKTKRKAITTKITFTLPIKTKQNKREKIIINDKIKIAYKILDSYKNDPVYQRYKGTSIGGVGWGFITNTNDENITSISIEFNDFYHPDFEFNNGEKEDTDFSEKTAITGREYFPHKEFIVKTFLENYSTIANSLDIDKISITINMFSNYIVEYFDGKNPSSFYSTLYALTNPRAYEFASDRFIERLSELNLSDEYIQIKELVDQSSIISNKTLQNFIIALINIILKDNIELHDNYKYFWKKDGNNYIPQTEPDMQPFIKGQLKTICDYVGIQISRESITAGGKVDFNCTYSHQGKILKCCIELKNAHNHNIEPGLTHQLPQYLTSERTRHGIYLILWYKGDKFNKPGNYESIAVLEKQLKTITPSRQSITTIIIDCNKPKPPSTI